MFGAPPIPRKKYYVVVGEFGDRDWYLYNVNTTFVTIRSWTSNPKKAIQFKSEDEAEQIAELVCKEDEFSVQGFTKFP